ncbi:MAG TPA: type II toxin-antitoxin system HicA family toxin [Ktedonobacteraceae bacterium]|nr:type II toxin-antitoxin system HicA family toxin [Ktedonobacteraceae bacterium]
MPLKVRELKAALSKAGFVWRPGKGSHTFWAHPDLPDEVTLSGKDGEDAKAYQVRDVRNALSKLGEKL